MAAKRTKLFSVKDQFKWSTVLSSHKSTFCSVNSAAFHTSIKVYLDYWYRIWQQCIHRDVMQGWISSCGDRTRQLCLPQLKTITAGLTLTFFFKWWNKCWICFVPSLCDCCTLRVLCWSFTSTHTVTDWSRLKQDTADKLLADLNVGHF